MINQRTQSQFVRVTAQYFSSKKSKAGFTLLETLLYLAILIVVSVMAVSILLSATTTFELARGRRVVGSEGAASMLRIVLETRQAAAIDTANSVFSVSTSTLSLVTTSGGSPTTRKFFVRGDALYTQVGSGVLEALTSSSTRVSLFTVRRFTTTHSEGVNIDLELETTGRAPVVASFSNTAIVRGGY